MAGEKVVLPKELQDALRKLEEIKREKRKEAAERGKQTRERKGGGDDKDIII